MSTLFPPPYHLDGAGKRVIVGLSYAETVEFEYIDASLPYAGKLIWVGDALPDDARRWLELWSKHRKGVEVGPQSEIGVRKQLAL